MGNNQNYLMVVLQLLGSLGLLIYGMRLMSEALQKLAGPQLRHILAKMTTNRITGMLTGTLVTCAVQSSSATTVMTVSFISAGLLTLAQASPSSRMPFCYMAETSQSARQTQVVWRLNSESREDQGPMILSRIKRPVPFILFS